MTSREISDPKSNIDSAEHGAASFWSLVAGTLRRTRSHPLSADWLPVLAAVAVALTVTLGLAAGLAD